MNNNMIEMIDPNDTSHSRYQYQYYDGILLKRRLPADKKWLPGWLASQTDMLADDWQIVE